ncbi:hypothetical protein HD806DRAFT_523144 [Xylariaceae sp. AK1471]|nr:hypothetical protein HD806DRAFT_523144 [Xylariaceae sp. AK1471]
MAELAPSLPYSKMEFDEEPGEMSRYAVTHTPQALITLETNTKVSDKTLHESHIDIGFPGPHDGYGQDEFPPIETLWAQILEEKKRSQPHSTNPIDTVYQESGSRAGARNQPGRRKERNNRHRQAPRRSERIKTLKGKNTKDPKSC